jgi:hypothetical protein
VVGRQQPEWKLDALARWTGRSVLSVTSHAERHVEDVVGSEQVLHPDIEIYEHLGILVPMGSWKQSLQSLMGTEADRVL